MIVDIEGEITLQYTKNGEVVCDSFERIRISDDGINDFTNWPDPHPGDNHERLH